MLGIVASTKKITGFHPKAQSYITASGITDGDRQRIINKLIVDFEAAGLLSKMYAGYLFFNGSANACKRNIVDSRDLDAAFRLNFQGGWTFASDGATPNGTTGWADTFIIPSVHTVTNGLSFGTYSATNTGAGNKVDLGCISPTNKYVQIYAHLGGTFYCQPNTDNSISDSMANTNTIGWFAGGRVASGQTYIQKDNVQQDKFTNTAYPTVSITTGAQNNNGTKQFFCDRKKVAEFYFQATTKAEGITIYNIVKACVDGLSGAPIVNAGSDQSILQPASSVNLVGSAVDNGSIVSYLWTKVSGPTCTITSPTTTSTSVTAMNTVGTYVFKLAATDNSALVGEDTVTITVGAAAGAQTLITVGSPAWNAYVHVPSDYDANPGLSYPTIIYFPGLGEVGSDANKLLNAGPSAYINSGGWNGNVLVGATTHKFIVISLQPTSAYPTEFSMNSRIAALKGLYRIDPARLFLAGFSHGSWCASTFVTGDALGGPFTYASQVAAVINVQGVMPSDNSPYPDLFDNFADVGGRYLAFEQVGDGRYSDVITNRMNARVANSGIWISTNDFGGGHGGGSENVPFGKISPPANYMLDGVPQNIYQWLAQQ